MLTNIVNKITPSYTGNNIITSQRRTISQWASVSMLMPQVSFIYPKVSLYIFFDISSRRHIFMDGGSFLLYFAKGYLIRLTLPQYPKKVSAILVKAAINGECSAQVASAEGGIRF